MPYSFRVNSRVDRYVNGYRVFEKSCILSRNRHGPSFDLATIRLRELEVSEGASYDLRFSYQGCVGVWEKEEQIETYQARGLGTIQC